MTRDNIRQAVIDLLGEFEGLPPESLTEDTQLIGAQAAIKSRTLVELLLALEDYAESDLGVEFDWTSDSAMSEARSIFRSVGSLTDHLFGLTQLR